MDNDLTAEEAAWIRQRGGAQSLWKRWKTTEEGWSRTEAEEGLALSLSRRPGRCLRLQGFFFDGVRAMRSPIFADRDSIWLSSSANE